MQNLKTQILTLTKKYVRLNHPKIKYKKGDKISYAGRVFDEDEVCNLISASLDFWLTAGKWTDLFEKELSKFLGIKFCTFVNSGSSANLLAFMTLTSPLLKDRAIKRGDEVITVAAAFPTTIAPIIQFGAVPVFVDITMPQYNIDINMLQKALSPKTKAVIVAHTLGNPFDIKAIKDFCDKNSLWLIEDNCDSLGSKYKMNGKWKYTGSFADLATQSFYPPHHITTGEGGACLTNNALLYKITLSLRDWGRDCSCPSGKDNVCGHRFDRQFSQLPKGYDHKYVYSHFGYNLKATDLQAAIGVAQIKKLPEFIKQRQNNWSYLSQELKDLSDILILPKPQENSIPSWFGFLIGIKESVNLSRQDLVSFLENKNIQTRMLFGGNLIKHPCFDFMRQDEKSYRIVGNLDNTDFVMNNAFWIGVSPLMNKEKLKFMVDAIKEAIYKNLKITPHSI
jgi:CDP-6-deoxy-D-xylo-4-hexulose-3-dehydrase